MLKPEKIGDLGQLYNEDCLVVLRSLPDNSVTGICCDPPYGLEFMGKEFDKLGDSKSMQQWHYNWAKEALRVAKPGAFMFVFGGSRTFHRLACAIEDAGWILRDTIMWVYGSGFPKGYSIDRGIDKKLGKEREIVGRRKHPTLKNTNKIEEQANAAHGENKWAREWDLTSPSSEQAKLFEGYNVSMKPAFEPILVCMKKTDGGFADNALKWGISGINIDAGRIGYIDEDDMNVGGRNKPTSSSKSMYGGKSYFESSTKAEHSPANKKGRYPANLILQHSPDCVRIGEKKVKGTVRSNGDAEVNVPFEDGITPLRRGTLVDRTDENGNETVEEWGCSLSCPIRQMNESVGIKKSGLLKAGHPYGKGDGQRVYAPLSGTVKHDTHNDSGFVSRYFKNLPPETPRFLYFPKASRAEREKGCGSLPVKECQTGCGGAMPIDDQGKDRDRFKKVASNVHPTVKSLSLIKYLASLLKMPQNTLILDMFAGSGTLGVACEQLKIPYILIEKEEEYCDIIRARVAAANEPDKPTKRKKIKKPTNTLIPWEEIQI